MLMQIVSHGRLSEIRHHSILRNSRVLACFNATPSKLKPSQRHVVNNSLNSTHNSGPKCLPWGFLKLSLTYIDFMSLILALFDLPMEVYFIQFNGSTIDKFYFWTYSLLKLLKLEPEKILEYTWQNDWAFPGKLHPKNIISIRYESLHTESCSNYERETTLYHIICMHTTRRPYSDSHIDVTHRVPWN